MVVRALGHREHIPLILPPTLSAVLPRQRWCITRGKEDEDFVEYGREKVSGRECERERAGRTIADDEIGRMRNVR